MSQMNQKEFIDVLAKKTGIQKKVILQLLNAIVEVFTEAVQQKRPIKVYGFGMLRHHYRKAFKAKGVFDDLYVAEKWYSTFKLSENIAYARQIKLKNSYDEIEDEE